MYSITNPKVTSIQLTQLLLRLGSLLKQHDLIIDSRKVVNGCIFCAYPGVHVDGRDFIDVAIQNGAHTILYENTHTTILSGGCQMVDRVDALTLDINKNNITQIPVDNLAQYVGLFAAYKYDQPSSKFKTIGVTGTNGKTSIAHWLNQAYMLFNCISAIIGTTGAGVYPNVTDYAMTTPDPITLQKLLYDFGLATIDYLVMEVSSHALHQGRVNGIDFKTAIFTNLTPDHLDYHGTMEEYFKAKRDLFYWYGLQHAIINIDDAYGHRLYNELIEAKKSTKLANLISYGIDNKECDLLASDIKMNLSGMQFSLNYNGQIQQIVVKVIGKFNIYNLLAVAAQLIIDGYTLSQIAGIFTQLRPVCGRMDAIINSNAPLVVIDYAHTPDALYNTLITLKQIEHTGHIYCVFGCGGDRDKTKRGSMGQIAIENSDYVIITTDNPRSEVPSAIIADILVGVSELESQNKVTNYQIIEDRCQAIEHAIKSAKANDIILIAGKGHETYQEINGVKYEFSDFKIAKNALNMLHS